MWRRSEISFFFLFLAHTNYKFIGFVIYTRETFTYIDINNNIQSNCPWLRRAAVFCNAKPIFFSFLNFWKKSLIIEIIIIINWCIILLLIISKWIKISIKFQNSASYSAIRKASSSFDRNIGLCYSSGVIVYM